MNNGNQIHLHIVPCNLKEACAFILEHHRHHKPPIFHKFSLAVADDTGDIHGVATIGRPIARFLDNGWTLEVNRLATDGTENACSALYSAAWRATKSLGYIKLITYILKDESGNSLRGSGWRCVGERGGGSWSRKSRPRVDSHPLQKKVLWEKSIDEEE